jgi:hypothetical protein
MGRLGGVIASERWWIPVSGPAADETIRGNPSPSAD